VRDGPTLYAGPSVWRSMEKTVFTIPNPHILGESQYVKRFDYYVRPFHAVTRTEVAEAISRVGRMPRKLGIRVRHCPPCDHSDGPTAQSPVLPRTHISEAYRASTVGLTDGCSFAASRRAT
jgi:hypothetical protein